MGITPDRYPNVMGFAGNRRWCSSWIAETAYPSSTSTTTRAPSGRRRARGLCGRRRAPFWDIEHSVKEAQRSRTRADRGGPWPVSQIWAAYRSGRRTLGSVVPSAVVLEFAVNNQPRRAQLQGDQGGVAWPSLRERAAKPIR